MDKITGLLGVPNVWHDLFSERGGWGRDLSGVRGSEIPRGASETEELQALELKVAATRGELQREIRQKTRLQEDLEAAGKAKQALLNVLPDPVVKLRRDGAVLAVDSPRGGRHVWPFGEIAGRNIDEMLPKSVALQFLHQMEQVLLKNEPQLFRFRHAAGGMCSGRDWEVRMAPIGRDEVIASIRDVSKRQEIEDKVVEACDKERERIGQDLHDTLGQHLSGIKFLCTALAQKVARDEPVHVSEVTYVEDQVNLALLQARNLARGLCLASLEERDLGPALRDLARGVENLGIRCHLTIEPSVPLNDMAAAKHLYHIAQEAMNNATKHGHPKNIWLGLTMAKNKLTLSIRDDGVGFPSSPGRRDGIGLRIMKCRARSIGARLMIRRQSNRGTCVVCSMNLPERQIL